MKGVADTYEISNGNIKAISKDKTMDKYGLIGKTLGHSFSRGYFNNRFAEEHLDAVYSNYEIPSIDGLKDILEDKEIVGLNVTIPYKQDVIPLLDGLSDEANRIGAVNVVKIDKETRKLTGYNTDVLGFVESIRPLIKPNHRKALILGTGGASKAVQYGLSQLGIECLFVSRTKRKGLITYSDINSDVLAEHKIIVNCTPLGTFPNIKECPELPFNLLNEDFLLFDLVYNPEMTQFLKQGKANGATIKNGLEMLHLQAKYAWGIWQK